MMAGWDDPPKLSLSSPVRRLQYLDEVPCATPSQKTRFLVELFLLLCQGKGGISPFNQHFGTKLDVVQDLTKHNTMKRAPMTFCGSKFHPWEISNKNHQIQVVGWKLLETAFLGQNFDSLLSQHADMVFHKKKQRINGNDPPK